MERSDTSDKPAMSDRSDTSGLPALSVAETAVLLDVNERTVRRYIEKGKLAAERVETDRHTIELRVTGAAIADYQGRRGAVEHEAHRVDTLADTVSDVAAPLSGTLSGRSGDLPALVSAISDRLEEQYHAPRQ